MLERLTYCGLNDVYFKKLIKENKELLPRLLKGICGIDVAYDDILMQNVEIQDEVNLKTTRFDISIKICNLRIDLENENTRHGDISYYDNRKMYYLARLHSSSYDKIDYNKMNKSYVIFLYNFDIGYKNLITESVMYNKTNKKEYQHFKVYDINLSKVNKSSTIELERLFDLLRSLDIEKYLAGNDPFLKGVADMIEEYDKDEILRLQAQLRKDNEIELRSMRNYAKKVGHDEGLREGRKEGMAQGKAEGRAEGIKSVARGMLKIGISIDQIIMATGLSEEEIKKLQ